MFMPPPKRINSKVNVIALLKFEHASYDITVQFVNHYAIRSVEIHGCFGSVGRVFANDPGDLDSTPGRVIPKTLKMVLHTSLLNTQQYKVRIDGKL